MPPKISSKAPAKRGRPASTNNTAKRRQMVQSEPVTRRISGETGTQQSQVPSGIFPLDFERLRCSLVTGNNVGSAHVSHDSNSTDLVLTIAAGGIPLDAGREFVRRITRLLDDAEAEGLNVGK